MENSIQSFSTTTTPPPQNPTESNQTAHFQELYGPFPSETNSPESNNLAQESPEQDKNGEVKVEGGARATTTAPQESEGSGRERLKRHRVEVAGRVWIPDMWGQEDFLKDWIDCAAFDATLVNSSILMARDSLMAERRRSANSTILRIQNGC